MIFKRVLLVPVVLFACSGKNHIPTGVLQPKEMQEVLWDVMRSDEMVDIQSEKDSLFRSSEKRYMYYDTIFALHHISRQKFQNSVNFYQNRPDLLKVIIDTLQKKSERYSSPM